VSQQASEFRWADIRVRGGIRPAPRWWCDHGTVVSDGTTATMSFARRFAAVRAAQGPLVFGLDPSADVLDSWELGDSADGLDRFADIVLAAAAGPVGLVKPQSAFYERHGWRGVRTLQRLVASARSAGLLVVLDIKRGDVGTTNDAYAEAYLGKGAPLAADAITVHPYLGLSAMSSFVSRAAESGSCLLVVTRSSNPDGRAIQAATSARGASVEQQLLRDIGALNARLAPGEIGPVGAVIGPTRLQPELDLAAANCLFLAPGVGVQGATPADVAAVFAACRDRVMPSASRSLLSAGPDVGRLRDALSALAAEFRGLLVG
jgi:orotidine-5'-phosphate decarboxylase